MPEIQPTRNFVRPAPAPVAQAAPAAPKRTSLQGHVDYFDTNRDGKITPAETRKGLEKVGVGPLKRAFMALAINGLIGPQSSGKATMTIDIKNIHKGNHAGDTGAIDAKGNHVKEKLDAYFTKYDVNKSNTLDETEIDALIQGAHPKWYGRLGAKGEFGQLIVIGPDGRETIKGKEVNSVSRKRLESIYDGTFFETVAAEYAAKAKPKK